MKHAQVALMMALGLVTQPALAVDDLIEPIVDQFFAELARRQGFIRVAAPGDTSAKIGSVYWVKDPPVRCAPDLGKIQSDARPLSVELLVDLEKPEAFVIKNWTSIRIDSFLGTNAQAALRATLPGREGDISTAIGYLRKVNAQVSFAVVERPSYRLREMTKAFFVEKKIQGASDLASDATGTLIPYAQIVLQAFTFDQEIAKRAELSAAAKFLEFIGIKLKGDMQTASHYKLTMPTNAVLAFKADRLLLPERCSVS